MTTTSKLCCPVCKSPLSRETGCFKCTTGHSFDISKYGYINLLPPSGKKIHGDDPLMVEARRLFLATGHYSPLRDGIVAACRRYADEGAYLDCGCGEGYYTEAVAEALGNEVYGIDISKDAVKHAARRVKNGTFAVASCYDLPFNRDSFSIATLIFSPLAKEEIHRVLKNDGTLIMAIPGKNHLFGLKKLLYPTPYYNTVSPYPIEGFRFMESMHIDYTLTLKGDDALRLFKMTPYYYRTPKEGKNKLLECEEITTDISFEVLCYKAEK